MLIIYYNAYQIYSFLYFLQGQFFAICCIAAAQASYYESGGGGGGEGYQLEGLPNLDSYGKLEYPKYDIQELGSEIHGEIPPKTIKVHKTITYKVPEPYPVKVPVKVPYPVHIEKPFPVVETKFIKVPHPVPYPVEKPIHVPVEVPKPFPVPAEEYKPPQQDAEGAQGWSGGFGGSFGGSEHIQQTYGVPGHEPGQPLGGESYQQYNSFGSSEYQGEGGDGHGEADQSANYAVSDKQDEGSSEQEQH